MTPPILSAVPGPMVNAPPSVGSWVTVNVERSNVPPETVRSVSPLKLTARFTMAADFATTRESNGVGVVVPPKIEGAPPTNETVAPVPSKIPLSVKLPATAKSTRAVTVPAMSRLLKVVESILPPMAVSPFMETVEPVPLKVPLSFQSPKIV